jgi:hypothetical protein
MNWDPSKRGDRLGQYCVVAAWASPVFPLFAIMSYCALPAIFAFVPWLFGFLALVCLVGTCVSLFSLFGMRRADMPVPAAVFGLILNFVVGCVAFLWWRGL